ncbi:MAG: hypothetical protein AMS16_06780 [Planctomycetes bacterium DG_58]|nr:MAG: hypothetical protein AMS16_06780 [Planctomycetes bacterium DG_58]
MVHFTGNRFTQHLVNRYRRYCVWEYAPNPGAYGYHEELDPKHLGLGYWRGGVHNIYRLILWYDPSLPERPLSDLPKTAFYPVWGHACMRNTWNDDAIFAVFKCGWFQGGEPPHHDDGTFVIYHKGNLVLDNNWNFNGCNAHSVNQNTITVLDPDETIMLASGRDIGRRRSRLNDGGQSFYDRKQTGPYDRGKVVAFEGNPQFLYVAGDATKSYHPDKMKEFVRQFVYVKPNIFLIFDRVESTKAEFEKRFVMHTHTEPLVADGVLRADASELLLAGPDLKAVYPYKYGNYIRENVPGFHQPKYERFETDWHTIEHVGDEAFGSVVASKAPNRKVTLEFECRFGDEEMAVVHNVGPQYGAVQWSLDAGKKKGVIDQHAATPAFQQRNVLMRGLAKGKHTLTLVAPTSLMNIEVFEVRLGGRMFVKTLLPENAKINVVEGYPESGGYQPRDRYGVKRRYRLEVRPPKASRRDCFLHVIQVGDLKTPKMMDVTTIAEDDVSGVVLDMDGRRCRFVFNRTGEVGGRVTIRGGGVRVDRRFTQVLNTPRDETLEASLVKARNVRRYDYETHQLRGLGPEADVATLRKALKEPKWYRRYHAARMLGMNGVRQAENDLITALSDDDPRVGSAAAEALGRLKSSTAVPPLTKQLSSPDATARFTAAWALGRIGTRGDAIVRTLTRTLGDEDPFVVYAAGDALGRLTRKADAETVAALIKVAGTKDHLAAAKAAEVLGDLKQVEAVPVLEKLALGADTSERIAAARALAKMNRPETTAFLREYITQGRGEAVARLAAARTSGRVELMRALMNEPEVRVRQKAVFELARKGDRPALDRLRSDLKSEDLGTRHGAAWALYRVGDKSGLIVLARDRLKVQQWSLADSAGNYLNYIDGVLGDKRPVVKALVDAVIEFIDEVEARGTTSEQPTTGRSLNFIHLHLTKCTGKKFFNWPKFKASKQAREQLKQRWLTYWEQEGKDLPEVPVKLGSKPE